MACPKNCETTSNVSHSLTEKLRTSLATTSEKFISYMKFSHMKKNFSAIYNENPEALKNIHDQACSQMKKAIMEDLNELCEELCVDFLLNSLEALQKNQENSQSSWRPSGDPKEDLRDHTYPLKLKHREDLQAILTKLQLSNEEYINEVSVNHAEIMHLKKVIDDYYKTFSNITTSLTGPNLEILQETLINRFD